MGGFLGALGGAVMNRMKNSGAGKLAQGYNRYRMGQAQGQTNDAMNQDMMNRANRQPGSGLLGIGDSDMRDHTPSGNGSPADVQNPALAARYDSTMPQGGGMLPGQPNGSMFGGRGDGYSVPGNEPGGSNGEYGAYGQNPDAAIPEGVGQDAESGMPAMARGGIVNKPTVALLGEDGPEAVVPLNNPNAKVTPGMFSHHRYRHMTGPSMVHGPGLRPMAPASVDDRMKESNWKKYDSTHPRI